MTPVKVIHMAAESSLLLLMQDVQDLDCLLSC